MAMMTTFSPFSILCPRKKDWGWKIFFHSFLENLFEMWAGDNCDGEMWAGVYTVHRQELQVWKFSYLYGTNTENTKK